MVAARELDQAQLSQQAQTWQNSHLVYTHGFGVVASPVNEQRAEGLPTFFLENIPPTGVPELALTQPRIYFGEKTDAYVFVGTLPTRPGEGPEFDYPLGEGNATYAYTGRDGVRLDSPLKRLIWPPTSATPMSSSAAPSLTRRAYSTIAPRSASAGWRPSSNSTATRTSPSSAVGWCGSRTPIPRPIAFPIPRRR
jgi:hypothetical protein